MDLNQLSSAEYNAYVSAKDKPSPMGKNMAVAFAVGGGLCVIAQILIDKTKLTPARILVSYVVLGVILGALGVYKPLAEFAGAGATVPLTGFGYNLAKGVKAIKLNDGDCVVSAKIIPSDTKEIVSVNNNGLIKKTPIDDFGVQGRGTKGSKIQKIDTDEYIADFYPLTNESEILVASNNSCIKIAVSEIPTLSKGAAGSRSIKLSPNSHIVGISKS